jgi:flagellar hook assembly protein FlgD
MSKATIHVGGSAAGAIGKVKNFPNPFYPKLHSKVAIRVPERYWGEKMGVTIYNMTGVQVRLLSESSATTTPQLGIAYWDGKNDSGDLVASGVYYYVVHVNNAKLRGQITLIK